MTSRHRRPEPGADKRSVQVSSRVERRLSGARAAPTVVSTAGSPAWNAPVGVGLAPGTLLGPEGSGRRPLWTIPPSHPARSVAAGARRRTGPRAGRPVADQRRVRCSPGADSRPYFENCTVDASIFSLCDQVTKGARWMPWHQEPKKDVEACDKPREAGNRAVIRGSPNGETRLESCPVTLA